VGKILREIKLNSDLEREEDNMASLLRCQSWLTSWTFVAAELCLFDRQLMIVFNTGNGHWRIIFQQILMVHAQEMDIRVYIRWWYWSNIPPVVIIPEARYYVTVSEGRCCCSVPDVKYCCSVLKLYIFLKFLKSEIVVELFPMSNIVPESLMSDIKAKLLMLDTWPTTTTALLCRKALLAIVYCTAQY